MSPPLREPLKPTPPSPPSPSPAPPPPPPPQQSVAAVVADDKNVVTLEFQRQKAKELQEYFKQKKVEAADQGPAFGFVAKNEINNGRYVIIFIHLSIGCYIDGLFGRILLDLRWTEFQQ